MDNPEQLVLIITFIATLIFLSGWFSGAETALTHLNLVQIANMKKRDVKNIKFILKLRKKMNRSIIAILIGNNIVNITLSAVVAIVSDSYFNAIGISIAMGVITFLIIMFGEITPKSHAIKDSEKIAIKRAKILYYFMKLISPLITSFIILTRIVLRFQGIKQRGKEILVSEESIAEMASLGHSEGILKVIEKDIIHKVFQFGEKKTRDIMVPLKSVLTIPEDTTFLKTKAIVVHSGFTRIPIINKKNRIIGVIYSKDLLNKERGSIKKLMRKPIIFNVATHITNAFSEMQKKHIHIAIIEDNLDRHVGIITLEDIIEELVGEIEDEYFKVKYKVGFPKI